MIVTHCAVDSLWWFVPGTWLTITLVFLLKDGIHVYHNSGDATFSQLLTILAGVPIALMFLTRWLP